MYSSSPRKRGRDDGDDYNSYGGGGYTGGHGKQRRLDIDAALPDSREYRSRPYHRGGSSNGRDYRQQGPRRSYNNSNNHNIIPLLSVGEKYCVDLWKMGDDPAAAGGSNTSEETSRFTTTTTDDMTALTSETCHVWTKGGRDDVLRAFRIAWAR